MSCKFGLVIKLELEGGTAISLDASLVFLVFFFVWRRPTDCLIALLFAPPSATSSFGGLSLVAFGLFAFLYLGPGTFGAFADCCCSVGATSLGAAGAFWRGVFGPFWLGTLACAPLAAGARESPLPTSLPTPLVEVRPLLFVDFCCCTGGCATC